MKKILVIEDDPQVRDNILDILSLEDFYTISASDGLEGLALAQEERPDVIICDIMLPKLSGYDVLAALRENLETKTIPFIFLTAKADRTDLRQGMDLGADDYLTKPFTPAELCQAIATRLEKHIYLEQKAQRKLGELRQNLAHSLPHELNTPLMGILNGAKLLRYCYQPIEQAEAIELLDCLERSGKRLHNLIQNFITYADLELIAADPEMVEVLRQQRVECSSRYLIENAAFRKAQQYDREADLQLELQDALLNIPESRFKKAVEEVIDNAFKFSSPGSVVRLVSRLRDDSFHLLVIDCGRGMTTEQIAEVGAYMQFQRKIYEQQGSGLGLTIAKRTVELYGGELAIESFPSQQTIIRLTIPISQPSQMISERCFKGVDWVW
jgi:two-component system, sensor histidine kinase and response regulator